MGSQVNSRLRSRLSSRELSVTRYDLLSVGTPLAAGVLPNGGRYTQAAGSNQVSEAVQTSASALLLWAFVANLPRIGLLADGGIGLVLEPPRRNELAQSRDLSVWTAGVAALTSNAAAGPDGRVLITKGDRVYVRGSDNTPVLDETNQATPYRIFRNATALKDPISGEILGYEAQYIGKAVLVRGESRTEIIGKDKKSQEAIVPATVDVVTTKEEVRVGDRLLPEPERQWLTYTPHAPAVQVDGRIVSVYGTAVSNAAQNQVVAINLGTNHGIEPGHVVSIQKAGATLSDKSDPNRPLMKLPDEHNGLMMVFRTFDTISYALVLEITHPVQVGDRLTNPR